MSVILVGGMDRLGEKYLKVAKYLGMELSIFSQARHNMGSKGKGPHN